MGHEAGRLIRDGRVLRREDGSIWNWRGSSMFLLPARMRNGEDVSDTFAWARAVGVNVLRLFPDWTIDRSNRGLNDTRWVADVLRTVKAEGFRSEVVAVTEYDRPLQDRRRIVAELDEIVSDDGFHFFQVENEPWNRGDDPRLALAGRTPRALTALGICPVNGPNLSPLFVPQISRKINDPTLTGSVDAGVAYLQAESLRCRGFLVTDEEKRLARDFIRARFPGWDESQPGTGEMVDLLLAEMDRRPPSTTPGSPMNYTDCVRRDYLTTHLQRDLAHYFRNGKDLEEMWGMQTFLVDDEPLGVADYDKTGSGARSTDRQAHVWHHTTSRLFGASTLHSQFGLEGRAPNDDEPISRRICDDIGAMWAAIPDHAYTGAYSRAGRADFPLDVRAEDAPDDNHPGTGYASIHGNIAYVVVPKATDRFRGEVDRRLTNGWRVVEAIGPADSAIYRVTQ